MHPVLRYNLRLLFVRQCHSRKDTPRLYLNLLLFIVRIAQLVQYPGFQYTGHVPGVTSSSR
jgi:hypothetical protein